MIFTDDDLERLKEDLPYIINEINGSGYKLYGLIARMETAERFINHSFMLIEWENHENYKAWRKAAGK